MSFKTTTVHDVHLKIINTSNRKIFKKMTIDEEYCSGNGLR